MTVRKYQSRSQKTSLASPLLAGASTMTVNSGPSLVVSTIPSGATFTVVIDPDTSLEEIVEVINWSSGNTLTINRGIDGSSDIAHSAGAVVRHMAIGRDYREANEHANGSLAQHTATTSLELKTLISDETGSGSLVFGTSPTIASPTITGTGTIAGTFTGNITGNVTGNVSGNAGTVTNGVYTTDNGTVTSAMIANNTIVNADISTSADIAKTKIAGTAVTVADTGTVTSTMIADGTIVNADINASAAIDKTKISGTAITAADTGTVTSTLIANDTIVNADINPTAGIAYTKLSLGGTITSADLVDGTIVASDIADGAITTAKMAVDPYARANHTGTQAASTISDFNTAVRTNRLDQMAAPTASVALNAQKITGLANPTSDQDAVTLKYLTDQKAAVNGIASLDGSGKIPTAQLPATAIADVFPVSSEAAMLALTADTGDIAIRSDLNKSYILRATPATTLSNWNELLTPTDTVLSVDGNTGVVNLSGLYVNHSGDTMTGDLVLNADPSLALGAATKQYVDAVAGSATSAAASATAAAASYDSFDDRYLGAKSTAPTVDNDGNSLVTGALYWDTVGNAMFAWNGSAWASISSTAAIYRYRYTATGGETSLSGPDANGLTLSYIAGKEQVYLNGVLLARTSDYTASNGTSITSLSALAVDDIVEIITFTAFDIATAIDKALFDAKGDILVGTAADTPGKLALGTNGYFLKADSSTTTGLVWAAVATNPLTGTGGDTGDTIYNGTTAPSSPTTGDIWFDSTVDTSADITIMTIMGGY